MKIAKELLRRRVLTQQKNGQNDLMNAVGQATFLYSYGKLPTIDDLRFKKNYLDFVTNDDSGQSIRVITTKDGWDYRIWSNTLDVDIYVFARWNKNEEECVLEGWMPRLDVEEAAFDWWEIDGEKVSYYHSVDEQAFIPMPAEQNFVVPCAHADMVATWDAQFTGWRCLLCDRILYDIPSRDRIGAYLGESRARTGDQTAS